MSGRTAIVVIETVLEQLAVVDVDPYDGEVDDDWALRDAANGAVDSISEHRLTTADAHAEWKYVWLVGAPCKAEDRGSFRWCEAHQSGLHGDETRCYRVIEWEQMAPHA